MSRSIVGFRLKLDAGFSYAILTREGRWRSVQGPEPVAPPVCTIDGVPFWLDRQMMVQFVTGFD